MKLNGSVTPRTIAARIVAEITVNWVEGETPAEPGDRLSDRFELVIRVNAARGFELEDWKLNSVYHRRAGRLMLTETIVAVFVRVAPEAAS